MVKYHRMRAQDYIVCPKIAATLRLFSLSFTYSKGIKGTVADDSGWLFFKSNSVPPHGQCRLRAQWTGIYEVFYLSSACYRRPPALAN